MSQVLISFTFYKLDLRSELNNYDAVLLFTISIAVCTLSISAVIENHNWHYSETSWISRHIFWKTFVFDFFSLCFFSSVQFSSVQDGICALGKAHMHSTSSLRSSPAYPLKRFYSSSDWQWPSLILLKKIILRWLTMALSHPFKEDHLALSLSMPLSSKRSVVWRPWLCSRR